MKVRETPVRRLRTNSLRQKLATSDFVVGTFLEIPSPAIVEILGLAGFDFVVVDREHGAIDLKETEDLVRASLATEISPMVRVPVCDRVAIRQPLDMGAAGLHIPQIETVDMALDAVRSSRYYPAGERGLQPYVRAASYRNGATTDYIDDANQEPLIVMQVEGKTGLDNLDSILAVDGVDVAFIGPYDLSQSLGIPGDVQNPVVQNHLADAAKRCRAAKKWAGCYCDNASAAAHYLSLGYAYLTLSIDASIFLSGAKSMLADLRAHLTDAQPRTGKN